MTNELPAKRGDLKRYEQAIRHGWEMPDEIYRALPRVLTTILAKGTAREQVAAARVLAQLHAQNNADQPRLSMVAHKHQHEVLPVAAGDLNDRRRELLARVAAIR
jgi:hypothetical protein